MNTDNFIVIIQARMDSSRLPGKSFAFINNKPILEYIIDSCLQIFNHKQIFVATSTNPSNSIIKDFCLKKDINCFLGNEENVASRYKQILQNTTLEGYFFRICGDTPLYDYRIMQKGMKILKQSPQMPDIISSMPNKGYPQGQNLELVRSALFVNHYDEFTQKEHFEHVTKFFYENISFFHSKLISCDIPDYKYEDTKFSIDTQEDFKKISTIFEHLNEAHYNYSLEKLYKIYKLI